MIGVTTVNDSSADNVDPDSTPVRSLLIKRLGSPIAFHWLCFIQILCIEQTPRVCI